MTNRKKFISKEKLSKKKKKELNNEKRNFWIINPTTRVPKNPKAYDRNREKKWRQDTSE